MMILTVDIGTTNLKAVIFDEELRIIRSSSVEIPLIVNGKFVEHDPRLMYELFVKLIRHVVKGFEDKVVALSVDSYNHGLLLLDKNYKPLTSILTHLDLRAEEVVRDFFASSKIDPYDIYAETGAPPLFIYAPYKIYWFKVKRPNIFSEARYFLMNKDFIILKLINDLYIDRGIASGAGLLDLRTLRYSNAVLNGLGIGEDNLPRLIDGALVLDYLKEGALQELGLEGKVALVLSTFDGAAQNFGLGLVGNDGVLNFGTTAVVRILNENYVVDRDRSMRFFAYYAADGYYSIGGASNNGGIVLSWAIKNLRLFESIDSLLGMAEKSRGCPEVYFMPFIAGERFPYRMGNLRASFLGLSLNHDLSVMAASIIEGIGFVLRVIDEAMEENGVKVGTYYMGGGGSRSLFLTKVFSNILRKRIVTTSVSEYLANLGSAVLAMRAIGHLSKGDYAKVLSKAGGELRVIDPEEPSLRYYDKCYEKFKKLVNTYMELNRVLVE